MLLLPRFNSSLDDGFLLSPEHVQQICFTLHVHTADRGAIDAEVQRYSKAGRDDVGLLQEHNTLCVRFVDTSRQSPQ